ncbi:MAG: HlyD family efflux transporter periplasmic adaptor subunit [Thermoguttaceae bacterium]|jgi:biotin carboxyl carrier protein
MTPEKKSSRQTAQVSLVAGIFFLAVAFAFSPIVGAGPEMSIFPVAPGNPAAGSGSGVATPSAASPPHELNLDIGRLDRSGRSPNAASSSDTTTPPEGRSFSILNRPQRIGIQLGLPRERSGLSELDSLPLLPLPDGVELGENDVLAKSALTEIPKGEGYEATVSANTQGKLISLGRQKRDENGEPMVDDDGNPVMIPMYRGMLVEEGEILGVQFNQAFHARRVAAERELEVAKKEAGKLLEVEVAEASKNVALMEYQRAVNANKRVANSVSEDEIWQKKYEWYRGEKSVDKAKYDLEIAALAVDVKEAAIAIADAELEERLIRAPLSGQVDDIFKNRGEWLREGDNVLHVLRLDKINITAVFDSETVSPSMIEGKAVTVYVSKAGVNGPQKMEGVITYARPVLVMNRFTAFASVENTQVDGSWVLIPGMRVNLIVHKDKDADPAAFSEIHE